jgi:hypothetical protein
MVALGAGERAFDVVRNHAVGSVFRALLVQFA